jgi:tetratricopeptide (TPR) repeat protein
MLTLFVLTGVVVAESPDAAVRDGNALYQEARYDEANERYAAAEKALPQAPEVHFNRGNAFFKQGNYAEAFKHYSQALQAASPELEPRLKYNLGNVKYHEALQTLQMPQTAIPHLRSAMTYYRDSLEVDAQQQNARYNLELAHRLLKQLEQQQQQQQQQQQDQQQQQQPSSEADSQSDADQQKQAQSETSSTSDKQQDDNPPAQSEQRTAREMTPEEAERLLEAIRERGREADQERQQRQRARMRSQRVEKDW